MCQESAGLGRWNNRPQRGHLLWHTRLNITTLTTETVTRVPIMTACEPVAARADRNAQKDAIETTQ